MHLSEYLTQRGDRARFAKAIGCTSAAVTFLCRDQYWPSREVWKRIVAETAGQVTPNDHLTVRTGATHEA